MNRIDEELRPMRIYLIDSGVGIDAHELVELIQGFSLALAKEDAFDDRWIYFDIGTSVSAHRHIITTPMISIQTLTHEECKNKNVFGLNVIVVDDWNEICDFGFATLYNKLMLGRIRYKFGIVDEYV